MIFLYKCINIDDLHSNDIFTPRTSIFSILYEARHSALWMDVEFHFSWFFSNSVIECCNFLLGVIEYNIFLKIFIGIWIWLKAICMNIFFIWEQNAPFSYMWTNIKKYFSFLNLEKEWSKVSFLVRTNDIIISWFCLNKKFSITVMDNIILVYYIGIFQGRF